MRETDRSSVDPVSGSQRVELLDALRGVALFGVLFVNMVWFATGGGAIGRPQLDALPTARIDRWVDFGMQLFLFAKANTIFTLLFGISFAMQMQRLERGGAAAVRTFTRRLCGLLVLGLIHLFGVWKGEILHVYALAGFLLLFAWRWRTAALIGVGVLLILGVHPLMLHADGLTAALAVAHTQASYMGRALASDIAQQHASAFRDGNYADVLLAQWAMLRASGYLFAGLAAWIVYALGRFMLGVAIARSGVLLQPDRYRSVLSATLLAALPLGLALTASRWIVQIGRARGWWSVDADQLGGLTDVLQQLGTLLQALSYMALIALCWTRPCLRQWLLPFTPVGRMALTNYLLQSLANATVFFGFGLGLGLIGRVGVSACLAISIALFAAQIVFSHWWLQAHPFGPLEWAWRWWTYGQRPGWSRR